MHAFEELVAGILEAEGYWIQSSFKVALTKEEKVSIGRPSAPRWEIDLIAYRAPENLVLAVECKSFIDSQGVDLSDLMGGRHAIRYKLFNDAALRGVVLKRLAADLTKAGFCSAKPKVKLALAAGRLKSDREAMRAYFDKKGWLLFDPAWISQQLRLSASRGYSDSVAVMVAKLLPLSDAKEGDS